MRAIVVPVSGQPYEVAIESYEDLSAAVGGYIQIMYYPGREDAVAYINEEGKLTGLAGNIVATRLMMTPEMGYLRGDYVAGDMVLIGANLTTGEDVDLPEDITVHSIEEAVR